MIVFEQVTITYPDAATPVLRGVDLRVREGELCLLVGRTGTGKSTLLRAVNGLVPHFTGGTLAGRVLVGGRDTRTHRPRDLADLVGVVGQDPAAGFVADVVEDELAYGMEWLGLDPQVMRRRVEETLDLLGLAELRDRPLGSLSGGQRQRVAIGAALAAHPRVLVLDEPTSALDPQAAEDVLATLQRLVHDLGLTVLLAEHRLERVVQYAEHVLHLPGDGRLEQGSPADVLRTAPVAPPVVELGRLAGWEPLPLTVRDARRRAGDLRARLALVGPPDGADSSPDRPDRSPRSASSPRSPSSWRHHGPVGPQGRPLVQLSGVSARYGRQVALRGVDLAVAAGEVVAVMGRNGAGKSTLLAAMVGLVRPAGGHVQLTGVAAPVDPAHAAAPDVARRAGLVPQQPADLLYAPTVARECTEGDRDAGAVPGSTRALLQRLAPGVDDEQHPRDLSEGQRLALALAVVLVAGPPLLLLDEPTRGLDYPTKARLVAVLRDLAADGHGVVLATHDVELVAEVATRVVVLADGEVVADGATADVVVGSPQFAPQVAKVLAPGPWLTVGDVARALERVS